MADGDLEATAKLIGSGGRAVISAMKPDFSFPMHRTASDTGLTKTAVRRLMKTLTYYGLVSRGPWYDEDDGMIKGSGYFLTDKGEKMKDILDA